MGMIFAAFEAHCAILPQSLLPGIAISSVVFAPVFPPVGHDVGQATILIFWLQRKSCFNKYNEADS